MIRYRNELIVAVALLFAIGAYIFKASSHQKVYSEAKQASQEVSQFEETIGLKKLWGNKNIAKKIDALKGLLPESKVSWQKRGKRITASFSELKPSEINLVVSKLMSLPVQITLLKIKKAGKHYSMEMKCKW